MVILIIVSADIKYFIIMLVSRIEGDLFWIIWSLVVGKEGGVWNSFLVCVVNLDYGFKGDVKVLVI